MRYILFLTLSLFLIGCHQKKVVGIVPYKGMAPDKVDTISKVISNFYDVKIVVLPERKLYKEAYTAVKSPRYRADSIIRIQKRADLDTLDYVLGLTNSDISITKYDTNENIRKPESRYRDFGIMGLAYCPGNSSVVSTYRIQHKDTEITLSRFKKVVIHEFGHNLGLPHCEDKHCVMTDAVEKIATVDNAKMKLCKKCKGKLN